MKQSWKVFWISCLIVSGIGFLMLFSGLALGANLETVQESIAGNVICKRIYTVTESQTGLQTSQHDGDKNVTATGTLYTGIRKLDVEVTNCQVIVRNSHGDGISVDDSNLNSGLGLTIKQEEDSLKIETEKHTMGTKNHGELYLYIPQGYLLSEADFEVGAGTLIADELRAEKLDLSVGAGQATLGNVVTSSLTDLKVECGAGQTTISFDGSQNDFNYKLECGIGAIEVGSDSYAGVAMERTIDNQSTRKAKIECGMGEVKLAFNKNHNYE